MEDAVPSRPLIVAGAIVASVLVVMATIPLWSGVVREDEAKAEAEERTWRTAEAREAAAGIVEAAAAAWRAARLWAENGF